MPDNWLPDRGSLFTRPLLHALTGCVGVLSREELFRSLA